MASLSLPAKRKRAQISYAEVGDDSFDSTYESGEDYAMIEIDHDLPEGDSVYGSRKVSRPARFASSPLMYLRRS
jgi:hypothetical protein